MKKQILFLILLAPNLLFSQNNSDSIPEITPNTQAEINMEEGINKLLQKSIRLNKEKEGIEGFSVKIYTGTSREIAQKTKYKFMKKFPEITTVSYERVNPNWVVKVGKLRTKLEAQKLQNTISSEYPNTFIINVTVRTGEFD